jgi:hypothetical protein
MRGRPSNRTCEKIVSACIGIYRFLALNMIFCVRLTQWDFWSGGRDLNLRQSGFCTLDRLNDAHLLVGVYSVSVSLDRSQAGSEALPS